MSKGATRLLAKNNLLNSGKIKKKYGVAGNDKYWSYFTIPILFLDDQTVFLEI